jgi:hypothetical protein
MFMGSLFSHATIYPSLSKSEQTGIFKHSTETGASVVHDCCMHNPKFTEWDAVPTELLVVAFIQTMTATTTTMATTTISRYSREVWPLVFARTIVGKYTGD